MLSEEEEEEEVERPLSTTPPVMDDWRRQFYISQTLRRVIMNEYTEPCIYELFRIAQERYAGDGGSEDNANLPVGSDEEIALRDRALLLVDFRSGFAGRLDSLEVYRPGGIAFNGLSVMDRRINEGKVYFL